MSIIFHRWLHSILQVPDNISQIRRAGWGGGGGGGGYKVVATFNHVGGSFDLFMAIAKMSEWSHISHLGLCAARGAHFMCHYEIWPAVASNPFSFPNSFAGGKHYQKITIPIFWLVEHIALPGNFPYNSLFCRYVFPFLLFRLFLLQYVFCFSQGNSYVLELL